MSGHSSIPVRTNLYLWLLTGRSTDFFNETLNTGISYSVSDTPPEVKSARALLRLHDTTTDFYVLAALAAAKMSTSMVRTLPHEHDAVFPSGMLSLPPVSSNRPMLPPDGHSWPSVDGGRAGADGFTQLVIRSLGSGMARITTNAGGGSDSACAVAAVTDGYRLSVTDLSEYGVRAHFQVDSWEVGDEVVVSLSPTRYPFAAVASAIRGSGDARRLMTAEGTLQAFAETSNAAVQVGLLGLAIIRRMLKFMNSEQIGFEVTASFDEGSPEPLRRVYTIDPSFEASLDTAPVDPDSPEGFDV